MIDVNRLPDSGDFMLEVGNQWTALTFVQLCDLKEKIDVLVSDETSRLLQADLMGTLTCDGCTI